MPKAAPKKAARKSARQTAAPKSHAPPPEALDPPLPPSRRPRPLPRRAK